MYKITDSNNIFRKSDGAFIPVTPDNIDYQQFVKDVYEQGTGIVEGADYVGVTTYTEARKAEYPPIEDQLDKIYHSGIDAWKEDIKVIKDKYPKTQVGITSIAPIPDWVKTALFDKQKIEYIRAKERLAQYELSAGVKGAVTTEKIWSAGFNSYTYEEIISYLVEPLPIEVDGKRNPLIVQDEAEREAAQEIINNTPQAVIDSISN